MLIGIDASRARRVGRTGTETYSLQLIRHLLALDSGHRFRLYLRQPPEPGLFLAERANVEWCIIPFPRLWTHLRLSWEMMRQSPDLLFVPSHVLPLWHPSRSVVTVHDLGYRYFPCTHSSFTRRYLEVSTRWNGRQAHRLLADSEATRQDLLKFYGVPEGKVRVVYPGVDETMKPVQDAATLTSVQARYGIQGPYILHVGTLHPRKNLLTLLRAFARLQMRQEVRQMGVRLVLAGGQGWHSSDAFQETERLGLSAQVIFAGHVPDADLPALLSGAVCLAFPTLYEGFGFPVVEAQACGTPVLCSNVSSLPEVAGDAAILLDPLDVDAWTEGLVQILTDEALRTDLTARGFDNVRRFPWPRCATEVMSILEEVGGV